MNDLPEEVKAVLPFTKQRGPTKYDRAKLLADWLPSDDLTIKHFCERHGIYPQLINRWGGARLWNDARVAFRARVLSRALNAAENSMEKKYETHLKAISKGIRLVERQFERMLENDIPVSKPFQKSIEEKLEILSKAMRNLSETDKSLRGLDIQKHEIQSINVHAQVVQSIKDRDEKYGLPEFKPE